MDYSRPKEKPSDAATRSAASHLEATLVRLRQLADGAIAAYRDEHDVQDPPAERVSSEDALWSTFADFLHRTRHRTREVHVAWDTFGTGRMPRAVRQLEHMVLADGGRLLALADSVAAAEEPGSTRLDDLVRLGAKVRVRQTDLPDAIVLDRNLAVLQERSDGRASIYVIRHKVVVGSLAKLVSTAWQSAVELDFFRRFETRSDSLTLYVIRLLAAGYKDEAAARELGMSVRTYRRHVATLMERLNAESRFQAGIQAAKAGLLTTT